MGGWGPTQKVPLCEVWDKGQLLFPSHGALPESGAEQHDLSLQWFARPGFQIDMYLSAWNQSLCMGTAHCTYKQAVRYLQNMVWQYWLGSAQNYIGLLHVRFQLDLCICFWVHLPLPITPCLCRLCHSFWFGLCAHAKICKLANFWDTVQFPCWRTCSRKKKV